jgi:hypothetical protein
MCFAVGSRFAIDLSMKRGKPGLIVPIRDRRQRRRILTLKNFRNAFLVALALFAGLTITAHVRNRNAPADEYGRLYGKQIPRAEIAPKPVEIIHESQIADADAADPMLVQAQARAQLLQADSNVPTAPPPLTTAGAMTATPAAKRAAGDEHVTIVGGPEGVTLVKKSTDRPELGGGFGRQ